MRIGFFDSGLGGLTVFQAVKSILPAGDLFYLGDTARTPYGSKAPETVVRYARECAHFLCQQDLDLLVVACNTASALSLEVLQRECPCPVIGTIGPAIEEVLLSANKNIIGIIGTESTIGSQAYQQALRKALPEAEVLAVACPLFVPLVEQGMFEGNIVDAVLDHYLSDLKDAGIEALVLGCTHYPMLTPGLQRYFGREVQLIECSTAIARQVSMLCPNDSPSDAISETYFVTDGESRFKMLSAHLLRSSEVEVVRINELPAVPGIPEQQSTEIS